VTEPLPEPPVAKFLEPLAAVWALLVVLSLFLLHTGVFSAGIPKGHRVLSSLSGGPTSSHVPHTIG